MPEIHYDSRGEAGIENIDELMARFPKWADRAANSALASAGFMLKNALQDAIDRGGPGVRSWQRLNPYTDLVRKRKRRVYKRTPKFTPGMGMSQKLPLLKFKGAIRYRVDKESKLLSVGFVNASAGLARMLGMHERGWTTTVTRKMQKKFFAMGLPLSQGRISTPPRPLVSPVWEEHQGQVVEMIGAKFFANLERYAREGK